MWLCGKGENGFRSRLQSSCSARGFNFKACIFNRVCLVCVFSLSRLLGVRSEEESLFLFSVLPFLFLEKFCSFPLPPSPSPPPPPPPSYMLLLKWLFKTAGEPSRWNAIVVFIVVSNDILGFDSCQCNFQPVSFLGEFFFSLLFRRGWGRGLYPVLSFLPGIQKSRSHLLRIQDYERSEYSSARSVCGQVCCFFRPLPSRLLDQLHCAPVRLSVTMTCLFVMNSE